MWHFSFVLALGTALATQPQAPSDASNRLLPPDAQRRQQIVQSIKAFGEVYARHLPNFACAPVSAPMPDWTFQKSNPPARAVTLDLDGARKPLPAETLLRNVRPDDLIRALFLANPEQRLEWDHWGTLRTKRMAVFRYTQEAGGTEFHGLIYAGENTGIVSRITFVGLPDLPASARCWPEEK